VTFTVRTSRRADADLDNHFSFIRKRSSTASAERWRDGLLRRLRDLAEDPHMWPMADEAAEAGIEVREFLYRRYRYVYRLLYRIEGNVIRILRIRSAAQDRLPPDEIG
jgi:plasmid stabilization system protein ParE